MLYTEALSIFDELVLKCADIKHIYRDSLKWRGFCLYKLNKYLETVNCYSKLSAIGPNMNGWGCGSYPLYWMGFYSDALKCCDKELVLENSISFPLNFCPNFGDHYKF